MFGQACNRSGICCASLSGIFPSPFPLAVMSSSIWIVISCLAIVIFVYFYNNPMLRGPWFLSRRFINWFPLGMTYSFLYMGRYNLTVAKNAFGTRMSNEDFGLIFAAGTGVYAFSFLVNGPLVDKIGGKK